MDEAWGICRRRRPGGKRKSQLQPVGFAPPTLAISWPETDRPGPFELRSGRRPEAPGEVVIDAALASDLDNPTSVELAFGGRPQQWTVVGVAGFGDQDSLGGAGFVLFELAVLQDQLDAVGELDTIDVAAAPGVPVDELVERIGSVLPEGTEATLLAEMSLRSRRRSSKKRSASSTPSCSSSPGFRSLSRHSSSRTRSGSWWRSGPRSSPCCAPSAPAAAR